jgi:hypothetical protein
VSFDMGMWAQDNRAHSILSSRVKIVEEFK